MSPGIGIEHKINHFNHKWSDPLIDTAIRDNLFAYHRGGIWHQAIVGLWGDGVDAPSNATEQQLDIALERRLNEPRKPNSFTDR